MKRTIKIDKKVAFVKREIEFIFALENISKVTRKEEYILARIWFYYILNKHLFLSHRICGQYVGKTSSNVTVALKKFDIKIKTFPNFKILFEENNENIVRELNKEIFIGKSLNKQEIDKVKLENIRVLDENYELKNKLLKFNKLYDICKHLPLDKFDEMIDYRCKPFVRLNT